MRKRAHVKIYGRVQGVFFRQEALRRAQAGNLSGWVRNNPDGSVEAVFEGEGPAVREMVDWCDSGSPSARVERVQTVWGPQKGEFDRFDII